MTKDFFGFILNSESGLPYLRRLSNLLPKIEAKLYDELVAVAEKNGQTKRYVLEQALRFYLHNVVPSPHLVRREVIDNFEQSVKRNRDLVERLAK